jgi:hypothetical protein
VHFDLPGYFARQVRGVSPRSYGASTTKCTRRTKADIDAIKDAIYRIVEADQPMTVRQTFYRLVATGIVDKSEGEYQRTVIRLLVRMRRDGDVPYSWIADNTRWMRKPQTFNSLQDGLADCAASYAPSGTSCPCTLSVGLRRTRWPA